MSDDRNDGYELGFVTVVALTENAVGFQLKGDTETYWVPRSVIHEDSDIDDSAAAPHDEGMLTVLKWWANKEGWA